MYDIIVVGCGASGAIASIFASRRGLSVAIVEANDRGFKKLLSTGNGRCNITNKNISLDCYNNTGRDLFQKAFDKFGFDETINFFSSIGVEVVELGEGKLYPLSLQASSVVNNLLDELKRNNIKIINNFPVTKIIRNKNFEVYSNDKKISSKSLIIATGGKSSAKEEYFNSIWKIISDLGIKKTKIYPSLVQLRSDYRYLKHLNGTKFKTTVKLIKENKEIKSFYGEVLFASYGVSGIPIMNLSRYFTDTDKKGYTLSLDLLESVSYEDLIDLMKKRRESISYKDLQSFFVGLIPKSLIIPMIKDNNFSTGQLARALSDKDIRKLCNYLKDFRINITDTNSFNRSQVMAGGVDINDLNDNLSAKKDKNLFFCGEIVNVDGICGGYNLQWAWSSAYIVGTNVLKSKK